MNTPYAEWDLGRYLRNALRGEASAQLLKPADAATVVLGTITAGGTAQDLERAVEAFPAGEGHAEPFERNARYAAAEFALDEAELASCCLPCGCALTAELCGAAASKREYCGSRNVAAFCRGGLVASCSSLPV